MKNYGFRLVPSYFKTSVVCLGTQLADVINRLAPGIGNVIWYAADIDYTGHAILHRQATLQSLGDTETSVASISGIDQFLSGVFLAASSTIKEPRFRDFIYTDDPADIDLIDAIVELRMFDTSFIEILTKNRNIADWISGILGIDYEE